jgi:hypothetical protein
MINWCEPIDNVSTFLIVLEPYQLNRIVSGNSAIKRIQQSNVGDNAAPKLLYVVRLPFQSLPHPFHPAANAIRA